MQKILFCLVLIGFSGKAFGAANMQLTSITVNTNGQIVSTLSPCATPLTPASSVSGITLSNSGNTNASTVVSATTSGCTLTVTTYGPASSNFPAFIDDAVGNISITLAAGSNLTDNSGNTVSASGNTGLHPVANNSTWVPLMGTYASTHLRVDGNPAIDNRGSTAHGAAWASVDGCARFNTDSGVTSINFLGFNFNNIITQWQDADTLVSTTNMTSGANFSSYSVTASGAHLYELCESNGGNTGNAGTVVLDAIQLVGGTFGAQPAVKPWVLWFGASEINCAFPFTSNNCIAWLTSRRLGYSDQSIGVAGWPVTTNTACVGIGCTVNNFTSSSLVSCSTRTVIPACGANFPKGAIPALAIFVDPGGNDVLDNTLIGANYTTAGAFKGDAVTMLGNLVSNYGDTSNRIYIFDQYCAPAIGSCTAPNSNPAVPWFTAWQGVAAAYNALSTGVTAVTDATFFQGCNNPTNGAPDYQAGGLHLTVTGYINWANCMLPVMASINSTAFSTIGSLSGNVGTDSSSVTITLNGINSNGTVSTFSTGNGGTHPQTVILASSVGSDTFSITGGTGGSACASPCTVTPANGASSFSFTSKPFTIGARTVSLTNGQGLGWVNPPTLPFTPSLVATGGTTISGNVVLSGSTTIR